VTEELDRPAALLHEPFGDIESLIRVTHSELVGVAFRVLGNKPDAEDAVQEACIKIMRAWSRVRSLLTAKQQRAYVCRTVANEALQIKRHQKQKRESLGADEGHNSFRIEPPDEAGQAAGEHLRLVWEAISELPERCRETTILFAAGYEYHEIAAMLGIQVSTVRSHINHAREQLPRTAPDAWEGA
jgi:RNA polymerase sigma-70 factor (ECF subfamily)